MIRTDPDFSRGTELRPPAAISRVGRDTIVCGDALQILRDIPDETIDCVLTDPPYATLDLARRAGTTTRLGGHQDPAKRDDTKWFKTVSNGRLLGVLWESYRVLKRDRHCYIMCDYETLRHLDGPAKALFQHVTPLIWDKEVFGMGFHYRRSFEFILMLDKGANRRLNDLGVRDVFRVRQPRGRSRLVPTEKPVELFQTLIAQSTRPGEVILDPFAGSGTTCLAAQRLRRHYIGIELRQAFVKIALNRCAVERDCAHHRTTETHCPSDP